MTRNHAFVGPGRVKWDVLPLAISPSGAQSVGDWRPAHDGGTLAEVINDVQTRFWHQCDQWLPEDQEACVHSLTLIGHEVEKAIVLKRDALTRVRFMVVDPAAVSKARNSLHHQDFMGSVNWFKERLPGCVIFVSPSTEDFDWFKAFFYGKRMIWKDIPNAEKFESDFVTSNENMAMSCQRSSKPFQAGGPPPPSGGNPLLYNFPIDISGTRSSGGDSAFGNAVQNRLRQARANVAHEMWLSLERDEIDREEMPLIATALAFNELQLLTEKDRLYSEMLSPRMRLNIDPIRKTALTFREDLKRKHLLPSRPEPKASGPIERQSNLDVSYSTPKMNFEPVEVVGVCLARPFNKLTMEERNVAARLGLRRQDTMMLHPKTAQVMDGIDRLRPTIATPMGSTVNLLFGFKK